MLLDIVQHANMQAFHVAAVKETAAITTEASPYPLPPSHQQQRKAHLLW
jgi:hypothetical protein